MKTVKKQKNIVIKGARVHNLKNIDVEIKSGGFTVVTGVSGSGKSSLVFDTLFAERAHQQQLHLRLSTAVLPF